MLIFLPQNFQERTKEKEVLKWLADWLTEMVDVYYKLFVVFVMMVVKESV